MNNASFRHYYNRLTELAIAMFDWQNIPDGFDPRFAELTLFSDGQAVFFKDDALGYLCLQNAMRGDLDVYRVPKSRRAFSVNGYQKQLTENDSVIIFNNYLHTPSKPDITLFAKRLWDFDRTIDVNVTAQKTPILLQCDETERLTVENLYKEYTGNAPVIHGTKGLNPNALKVITTGAPFTAPAIYELRTQIWNEVLTYLGISNINNVKKERMISDEVSRNQGGTVASRYSRLKSRQQACEKINAMFGLNMSCEYSDDFKIISEGVYEQYYRNEEQGGDSNNE